MNETRHRFSHDDEVEHLEVIVGGRLAYQRAYQRGKLKRLTPPQVRMSFDLAADGGVHQRDWSFAVAYEIPEHRRSTFGADAIAILYDRSGWRVHSIDLTDDHPDKP